MLLEAFAQPAVWCAALFAAAAIAPPLSGPAQRPPSRVVLVSSGPAAPYEGALGAFRAELAGEVDLHLIDAGDPQAAAKLHALEPQVLVPFGTHATSWVQASGVDAPIVFAMVLNPVLSNLVDSYATPGRRTTGAALDIAFEQQFRTLRELVNAQRVAVLYDPNRTRTLVREAVSAAQRVGVELVGIEVPDATLLEDALSRVGHEFDALWSVADSTVLARGVVNRILLYTLDERIPYMGISEQYVRAGALFALVTSYEENGRQAAALVRRVLAGEPAGAIPLATPQVVEVVLNAKTARRLSLDPALRTSLRLREVP